MNPDEIKKALKRHGYTMKSIAAELGCSPAAVTLVIQRKSVSERTMEAVAKAIMQPIEIVFPERFKKAS
jgi:lambda repressor-like predicted transcriptional regulator